MSCRSLNAVYERLSEVIQRNLEPLVRFRIILKAIVPKLDRPSENKLPKKDPIFRNFLGDKSSNFLVLFYFLLLNQKTGMPVSSAITPRITASMPAPKNIQTENPKPKKV